MLLMKRQSDLVERASKIRNETQSLNERVKQLTARYGSLISSGKSSPEERTDIFESYVLLLFEKGKLEAELDELLEELTRS